MLISRNMAVKPSFARILARDRRRAAAHEAGHVVVARHLGSRNATAVIQPTGETDLKYCTWIGQAACGMQTASRKRRAMCGFAGAIAERVLYPQPESRPMDRRLMWDELHEGDLGELISPTDWRMCGCEPATLTTKAVTCALEVWSLLHGKLRPVLLVETRRLIFESQATRRTNPPTT